MEIALDWLSEFVDLPPVDELCDVLTRAGVEVEAVSDPQSEVQDVVVAEVTHCVKHPKADKLNLCQVHDGIETRSVVCGADNVRAGLKVAYGREGAVLPGGFVLGKRKLRGEMSHGMICAKNELGLEDKSEGIWELPQDWPVGVQVLDYANVSGKLTLGITPNRPDLLSHLGVAREVAAATGQRLKWAGRPFTGQGPDIQGLARVVVEDSKACKRYVARVVRGLTVGPSPDWLRERLERVGARSVNNVVDVTNYVLFELGQPLHAFDLARLVSDRGTPMVRVRRATAGEKLTTLDGEERTLTDEDLIIGDGVRPIALAGVMGGQDSEVTDTTTSVLLESAYFDPTVVRMSARRHGLRTDASQRFERGADPNAAIKAIDRCAKLLREVAGGESAKGVIEVTAQKNEPPHEIRLRLERVRRVLGIELAAEAVVQLLEPLQIRCAVRNESILNFEVPSFRPDLTREADLIEEVARRYGYDNIETHLPSAAQVYRYEALPVSHTQAVRDTLMAAGCDEAVNYGFGSPRDVVWFVGGEGNNGNGNGSAGEVLRLRNPLGEEHSAMRTSLLPGLLHNLAHNQRHGARAMRLFETGVTFHRRDPHPEDSLRDRGLPTEMQRVAWVVYGGRDFGSWYEGGAHAGFADVAGMAESVCDVFGLAQETGRVACRVHGLHPHRAAEVKVGDTVVGTVGELHPDAQAHFGLQGPVAVAELSLTALSQLPRRALGYQPLPKYPGTRRDFAIVVDQTVTAAALTEFVRKNGGGRMGPGVVSDVRLFDVYDGDQIPEGKVSLAFAIDYQSPKRTLKDSDVGPAFEELLERLKSKFSADIR